MDKMKKIYYLLLILCILNFGDYLTTVLALDNGASEVNPIAKFFIQFGLLHWFKIVGISLICLYLIWRSRKNTEGQIRIIKLLKWVNIIYLIIVLFNTSTIILQKTINN